MALIKDRRAQNKCVEDIAIDDKNNHFTSAIEYSMSL